MSRLEPSQLLVEKWGSKETWLRALAVRSRFLWLLRREFVHLELADKATLTAALSDLFLLANDAAAAHPTDELAFAETRAKLTTYLDNRLLVFAESDILRRLRDLVSSFDGPDPIEDLFAELRERTEAIYGGRTREARLSRQWLSEHPKGPPSPSDYPDPYHIDAVTSPGVREALVELQVHLDGFDALSFLALPALLTHELVCHAHAREEGNNQQSFWADGVMEWVASFFWKRWLFDLGLPTGIATRQGEHLGAARMTPWRQGGITAAEVTRDWLAEDPSVRSPGVAEPLMAKLALEVNLLEAPLLDKDTLASRMANIRGDLGLQRALTNWRSGALRIEALLSAS
jgi:hypothetical protein